MVAGGFSTLEVELEVLRPVVFAGLAEPGLLEHARSGDIAGIRARSAKFLDQRHHYVRVRTGRGELDRSDTRRVSGRGRYVAEHVAEVEDEVVGQVVLSRGWVDAVAGAVMVRVLSSLGVLPARQRQGIGRALVECAVHSSEEAGGPAIFLEGDPGYYSRFGFLPAASQHFKYACLRRTSRG